MGAELKSCHLCAEEIRSHGDILCGVVAAFTLNGEEAAVADILECCKIFIEGNATLTERQLKIGSLFAVEHYAVFCVGVDDVFTELVNSLDGVIGRAHDKVCGVEVYTHALCTQAVEKFTEHGSGLRTCFNRKISTDAVAVVSQLLAG